MIYVMIKSEILLEFVPSIGLIASLLATEGEVRRAPGLLCQSGVHPSRFSGVRRGREGKEALHRQISGHLHFPKSLAS